MTVDFEIWTPDQQWLAKIVPEDELLSTIERMGDALPESGKDQVVACLRVIRRQPTDQRD